MSKSAGELAYQLSFQVSPIIFVNGIAQFMPGGMLPVIAITESLNFALGLLAGSTGQVGLDNFFASYEPLPGSRLISQRLGEYPFANQQVAANAVIQEKLNVSLVMHCPVRQQGGYAAKLATMTALRAAFAQHNNSGGSYTIATPSYIYTGCLFVDMRDTTPAGSKQPQSQYVLDFYQPLLTLEQAAEAQNNLMSKITAGTAIDGQPAWSGLSPTVGQPPSLAGPSLVPAQTSLTGAGAAINIPASGPA